MFSGLMASVALCRDQRTNAGRGAKDETVQSTRFVRRLSVAERVGSMRNLNVTADMGGEEGGETVQSIPQTPRAENHRDQPLLPGHGQHGVIAARPPGCGVDEEVDGLVRHWDRRWLREHDVQINRSKDLLEGIEGKPTQFAFDEVWPVLHDGLELEVPVPALPARDKVEHVGALSCPPVLPAGSAGEGDTEGREEREVGGLVPHAEQPREEVDLRCDGGDGQQARCPHDEEGEYCLVGEVGVDVGRLLKDDDVATGSFGC